MADTFSINPGEPVAQNPGADGQAVLAQAQAAPPSQTIATMQAPDTAFNSATTDALLKLGSDILAPKIKEAQQTQFMNGVQRVMQGEAVKDIVEKQPWYTEVFGPSSAVQGARAYTVAQDIAQFGADMETAMPKLAEQGPEALTGAIQNKLNSLKTGDPVADAAIMSQAVDQMAPLYKRHAKEHYLYQQNQANRTQVNSWGSFGDAYQARAAAAADPRHTVSPDDLAVDRQRFIGALGPFADQTQESYERNVEHFLGAAAQKGNMHVVKMFKDEGFLNQLSPEAQARLEPVFRAGGARALADAMPSFATDIAMLEKDYTQNPANIPKRAAEINARASEQTGVPVTDHQLIPGHAQVSAVGAVLTHQQAQLAAQLEEGRKLSAAAMAIDPDQPTSAAGVVAVKATDDAHIEQALSLTWNMQDPKRAAAIANKVGSFKTSIISSTFSAAMSTDEATDAGFNALQTYRLMGDEAKAAALNGHSSPAQNFLASLDKNMQSGMPIALAWKASKVVAPAADFAIPDGDKNKVDKAIKDVANDANTKWWGRQTIDDASLRTVTALTKQNYKTISNGGIVPPDQAAKQAYFALQQSGSIEQVGRHILLTNPKAPGIETKSYYTGGENNIGTEPAGAAFDAVFKDKVAAQGLDADLVQFMFRSPDVNGVPQYTASLTDKNGGAHMVSWNGAEVKEQGIGKRKMLAPPLLPTLPKRNSDTVTPTAPNVLGAEPLDEASQTPTR